MKAWLADRQGAMAGRDLADRFGWKIGDRIPIQGRHLAAKIWRRRDLGVQPRRHLRGETRWSTRPTSSSATTTSTRTGSSARVRSGWYIVKIDDPSRSVEMAQTFDDMFANSAAETKTTTEKGFVEGFAKQIGDIGAIMIAILIAVLFTILLVVANTMAQSVRERTSELAVLKTLGFSNVTSARSWCSPSRSLSRCSAAGSASHSPGPSSRRATPPVAMLPAFVLPSRDLATGRRADAGARRAGRRAAGHSGDAACASPTR